MNKTPTIKSKKHMMLVSKDLLCQIILIVVALPTIFSRTNYTKHNSLIHNCDNLSANNLLPLFINHITHNNPSHNLLLKSFYKPKYAVRYIIKPLSSRKFSIFYSIYHIKSFSSTYFSALDINNMTLCEFKFKS